MSGSDRDAILRRRARFVAAALASAGVVLPGVEGCAKKETGPVAPPISTAYVPEADAGELSSELDAELVTTETQAPEDAGAPPERPPEHPPTVCLSPPMPQPHVCLSVPAPSPSPGPKPKPRICLDFT